MHWYTVQWVKHDVLDKVYESNNVINWKWKIGKKVWG